MELFTGGRRSVVITIMERFFNETNRRDAISRLANPRVKDSSGTVEWLNEVLNECTRLKKRHTRLIDNKE